MMEEMQQKGVKRRKEWKKSSSKKSKNKQKLRTLGPGSEHGRVKKMDKKMKKFLQKKARSYNSDDDEVEEEDRNLKWGEKQSGVVKDEVKGGFKSKFSDSDEEGEENGEEKIEVSEDEDGEIQPGVMRFSEGCKAFRLAFKKITKKTASTDHDVLGPVLSAHKKLVAEKLAEEEAERKVKGEAKKEKHLVGEKGHVKPANYLDSHEKHLVGVATRGVVKLFNAVNKAQHSQRGLNPSRSKDEKVIKKQRKEAFFSVLGQTPSQNTGSIEKIGASAGTGSVDAPAWAPLRDNYMLTNSKLKDWDKMPDTAAVDDFGLRPDADSSSDDE
ncbi:uncharacterized protein [Coffea arabica]|nr:RRP15-like protein [Coffea arabica]XP_027076442.1 RRP15-like protein [Coffea arabica]